MSFGKSRARLMTRERNKVTFDDVAGIDEAKEEVQEIIEFLKDPKKFQKLGGRIPGRDPRRPARTGKTLLAKAIAGEAQVPFFSISGRTSWRCSWASARPRARHVRAGQEERPLHYLHRRDRCLGRSRFSGIAAATTSASRPLTPCWSRWTASTRRRA